MLYLLYLFIRKIELPHYYASLKLLFFIHINLICLSLEIDMSLSAFENSFTDLKSAQRDRSRLIIFEKQIYLSPGNLL